MRKNWFAFILLLSFAFIGFDALGQSKKDKKSICLNKFQSVNSISILHGSTTTSVAFTSINGFQNKKLFAGIGTGLDFYFHTSVPLFLEGRYDLTHKKNKIQVVADGGLNFPFARQNNKYETKAGNYKAAIFWAAGLDYEIPVHHHAMILGFAFSVKHIIQMVENNTWNPVLNRIENVPIKYNYQLNRVAVKLGWIF
jgi:hypothetical protein